MQTRFRFLVGFSAFLYGAWLCLVDYFSTGAALVPFLGNLSGGVLAGIFFVFVGGRAAPALQALDIELPRPPQPASHLFWGVVIFWLLLIGQQGGNISLTLGRGILLGLLMWAAGHIEILIERDKPVSYAFSAVIYFLTVVGAALFARLLFDSTPFLIAAVATRITVGSFAHRLTPSQLAFLLGTVCGIGVVSLPAIAYFRQTL